MIRLQGKYRLTFPITPGEIQFKGYGNETESTTSITFVSLNRKTAMRAKSIAFEFWLPGDPENDLIEVDGYQGPRAWLNGLDRLQGAEVLLTINEMDLAWNVLIGPCDGTFKGINADYYGTIEFPIYIKQEFVTWSNSKQLLKPGNVITQQKPKRANTSGKSAKKKKTSSAQSQSLVNIQAIQAAQRSRIDKKNDSIMPWRLQ